jgi:hypothetical protein
LKEKYGWNNEICLTIIEREIQIGMTPEMVKAAWGKPKDVNRTTLTSFVNEQWVYGDVFNGSYVYFEGPNQSSMKVSAIQN